MKKILLLFVFAICASLSFGQIKVQTNGMSSFGDTSTPAADQIHVKAINAAVRVESSSNTAALQIDNTVNSWRFFNNAGGAMNLRDVTGGKNIFRIDAGSSAGSFRIASTGNVGLGVASPAEKLHVGGNILATGTVTPSAKRLKNNINSFELGLDQVLQIRPMTYNYNGKAGISSDRLHVGVIAEEFQKIVPNAVMPYTYIEENDNGDILSQEDFLSVDEKSITYMLVNAVKQQQDMIEAQNETIDRLSEMVKSFGNSEGINNTNINLSAYDLAELDQNTPNPFNGETSISYIIPTEAQSAQISVFGQNGQLMKTLDIDHVGKGTLTVDASDLPSGTYSYQLLVDGRSVETNVMVKTQ